MSKVKIIALAGSLRKDSVNKKLVRIAAQAATEAGAEVTYVDLKDFPMPIYDQDIEDASGLPEHAQRLKELFKSHQGIIIASPEYNSSVSAALKNAIDWISRQGEGEKALAAFDGKVAALLSASPGGLGGLRGLVHLRSILGNIKVTVLPDQIAVSQAYEAFNEKGELLDAAKQKTVKALGAKLVEVTKKLNV